MYTLSDGATAKVDEKNQESGITANDFTNPVTYTITASDGETIQDWIVTIDVAGSLGIEGNSYHGLRIYPNPISDKAVIEVQNPMGLELDLSIYGVLGQKIFERKILKSEDIILKKRDMSAGVYIVILRGDKLLETRKVIIE